MSTNTIRKRDIDSEALISEVMKYLNFLLDETEVVSDNGEKCIVEGIRFNSNAISIYSSSNFNPNSRLKYIIRGEDSVKIEILKFYLADYLRIRIKQFKDKPNDKIYKRALIGAKMDTLTIEDPSKSENAEGIEVVVYKTLFYIDESDRCDKDPRPKLEKMALFQACSNIDQMCVILHTYGFKKGYLKTLDDSQSQDWIIGINNEGNSEKICSSEIIDLKKQELEYKDGGNKNITNLQFSDYAYHPIVERVDKGTTTFVETLSLNRKTLSNELAEALKLKRGIILLNKFQIRDLFNSNLNKIYDYKTILNIGERMLTLDSPKIMMDYVRDFDKKKFKKLEKLLVDNIKENRFEVIIDSYSTLSIDSMLALSKNSLIIRAEDINDFNRYLDELHEVKESNINLFIENINYIGDIETGYGVILNRAIKTLMKQNDKNLFKNLLKPSSSIESLLKAVFSDEVNAKELRIIGTDIAIIQDDGIPKIFNKYKIVEESVLYFLWGVAENLGDVLIKELEENKYTSILYLVKTNNGNKNVKIILQKNNKYELTAKILDKGVDDKLLEVLNKNDLDIKSLFKKAEIINFHGFSGTGKTTSIKALIDRINPKSIIVVDSENEYSPNEYSNVQSIFLRKPFNPNKIRMNNFDVLIIDKLPKGVNIFDILLATKSSVIIIVATILPLEVTLKSENSDVSKEYIEMLLKNRMISIDCNID